MKKFMKATLISCIIAATAVSATASVSAACPLTSLLSGGLTGVLQSGAGGQSCGSGLLQSILASKGSGNSSCGSGMLGSVLGTGNSSCGSGILGSVVGAGNTGCTNGNTNCTGSCENGGTACVSASEKASITLSKSSVTMKTNTTETINVSVNNVDGLSVTSSSSCVKAVSTGISGGKATVTVTGTCKGVATVKICAKNQPSVCKTVSVVVTDAPAADKESGNSGTNGSTADTGSTQALSYAEEVLKYVNEARAANGLGALKLNSTLSKAAGIRVNEIKRSFSHTRPDGRSCFTVFAEAGYTYSAAGENIARGYSSAKSVVNAWLASPGHRANILSNRYTYMGLAKDGTYWAQLFAA